MTSKFRFGTNLFYNNVIFVLIDVWEARDISMKGAVNEV